MAMGTEIKEKLDKTKWTGFSNRLDSGDGRERKNSQRINIILKYKTNHGFLLLFRKF